MKVVNIIAFPALTTSATAPAAQFLRGGNSGGGGFLKPLEPMNEEKLGAFIRDEVPLLARYYFNAVIPVFHPAIEPASWVQFTDKGEQFGRDLTVPLYQKAFAGPATIFTQMEKSHIKLQREPCVDPNAGGLRDASANAETGELCFDTKSLIKNVPVVILRSHVLALAIHEYTHLVHSTEREALFAETLARETVKVDGTILDYLRTQWALRAGEWSTTADLRLFIDSVPTTSDTALVVRLLEVSRSVSEMIIRPFDLIAMSWLSPWTMQQRLEGVILLTKLESLEALACGLPGISEADPNARALGCADHDPDQLRLGWKEYTIAELMKNSGNTAAPLTTPYVFRKVMPIDRKAVQAELEDVRDLLLDLYPEKH